MAGTTAVSILPDTPGGHNATARTKACGVCGIGGIIGAGGTNGAGESIGDGGSISIGAGSIAAGGFSYSLISGLSGALSGGGGDVGFNELMGVFWLFFFSFLQA